jgi:hypothetical protein
LSKRGTSASRRCSSPLRRTCRGLAAAKLGRSKSNLRPAAKKSRPDCNPNGEEKTTKLGNNMKTASNRQAGARRHRQDKPRLTNEQGRAQRRVGELAKVYRDQYPKGLPHNSVGVKYAKYICRTLAFLPRDDRAKWLDRNAAWLDADTRDYILSLGPYWYNDRSLGDHLELYDEDRERLGIRTIEACDVTFEQRKEINRDKEVRRLEKRRRQNGAKPREQYLAESLSRTKPWEADKISRATWYRQCRETGPTVSSLLNRQTCALVSSAAIASAERGNVLDYQARRSDICRTPTARPGTTDTTRLTRFKEAA